MVSSSFRGLRTIASANKPSAPKPVLFFRRVEDLGSDARIDAVVELVVPDLAGGSRLVLDPVLAGLVVREGLGTGRDATLADIRHLVDGFVVFVGHGDELLLAFVFVAVVPLSTSTRTGAVVSRFVNGGRAGET